MTIEEMKKGLEGFEVFLESLKETTQQLRENNELLTKMYQYYKEERQLKQQQ